MGAALPLYVCTCTLIPPPPFRASWRGHASKGPPLISVKRQGNGICLLVRVRSLSLGPQRVGMIPAGWPITSLLRQWPPTTLQVPTLAYEYKGVKYGAPFHSPRGTLARSLFQFGQEIITRRPRRVTSPSVTTYTRASPGRGEQRVGYLNNYLDEDNPRHHPCPCSSPGTHSELAPALASFGKDVDLDQ